MKAKLTQKMLTKYLTPDKGSTTIWDTELKGFGLRITAKGAHSYFLAYLIKGRERRVTIGATSELTVVEAARDKAAKLKVRIKDGKGEYDPQDEAQQEREENLEEKTIADLCEKYMEDTKKGGGGSKRPSSQRNDRSMIKNIIVPAFGRRRLSAVTENDIEKLRDSRKAHPYRFNRTLALLRTMYNYAMDDKRKWATANPASAVDMYPEVEREWMLSLDQMRQFRAAIDSYPDKSAANALKLLLLTGAREQEVLGAQWQEFNLDLHTWTKPAIRVKTGKPEHVTLGDEAIAVLESMMPANPVGPLFPGKDGKKARVTVRRPWVQACKAAGLAAAYEVTGKRDKPLTKYRPTMRIHDLRHNFISYIVSRGVSLPLAGKMVGHHSAATTARYAHFEDAAQREAANIFGDVYKKSGAENVVTMPKTGTK